MFYNTQEVELYQNLFNTLFSIFSVVLYEVVTKGYETTIKQTLTDQFLYHVFFGINVLSP
jgi:hypothetical protein